MIDPEAHEAAESVAIMICSCATSEQHRVDVKLVLQYRETIREPLLARIAELEAALREATCT
jgi:hypothetical protein